jgi:hypothetical protein
LELFRGIAVFRRHGVSVLIPTLKGLGRIESGIAPTVIVEDVIPDRHDGSS